MKALTLHQPWASLIAVGAKKIETRSWSTSYRGPLAIHAAASVPTSVRGAVLGLKRGGRMHSVYAGNKTIIDALYRAGYAQWLDEGTITERDREYGKPLPLGAVVATCLLVDVVPIIAFEPEPPEGNDVALASEVRQAIYVDDQWLTEYNLQRGVREHDPERPFGDYTPGRYAWLLDNIQPLEPIPAKGRQGLWEWTHGCFICQAGDDAAPWASEEGCSDCEHRFVDEVVRA